MSNSVIVNSRSFGSLEIVTCSAKAATAPDECCHVSPAPKGNTSCCIRSSFWIHALDNLDVEEEGEDNIQLSSLQ